MSRKVFFVATVLCHAISVSCFAVANESRKNSLAIALSGGDYYRVYRVSSAMEEESPAEFEKIGLEPYLKSLFVIGAPKQISEECTRLAKSVLANYLCALYYTENKNTEDAKKYYSAIQKPSKFFWPAQILKASCELIVNNPDEAISTLKLEDRAQYKSLGLESLFNLTRARVLIVLENYEEAVKYSQAVESTSPHYLESLEQTAWVFFKTRRLESAQILLDVIISSFESLKKSERDLKVSPTLYFKSRYLKAYLALIEQRPEGASNEFSQLKGSFDQYMASFKSNLSPDKMVKDFSKSKGVSSMTDLPTYLDTQISYISEWLGANVATKYEKEIRFQTALNREIEKISYYKKFERNPSQLSTEDKYLYQLTKLKTQSFSILQQQYTTILQRLGLSMSTLSLKADLGRLDVFWLNRAEGARNLDEVIDNYKQTTKSFENYMDL